MASVLEQGRTRSRRVGCAITSLVATGVLVLSACTDVGLPRSPGGAATSTPEESHAAPAAFAESDKSLLGEFTEGELADDSAGVTRVVIPHSMGDRNLTLAIELATNKGLRNNAVARGTGYTQDWQAIGSSPDAVGVLLSTSLQVDGEQRNVPITVWYDPASSRGVAAPGLIALDSWPDFVKQVRAALPAGADPATIKDALDGQSAPYGDGPAIGFDPEGNALVAFRSDVLPDLVQIPRPQIESLLSPFGQDALDAATAPSAFDPGAEPQERDRATGVGGEDENAGSSPSPEPSALDIPEGPGGAGDEQPSEEPEESAVRPYPWVGVNCKVQKCVAMTYDDGPSSGTKEVVDTYLSQGQATSFFILGQVLVDNKELTRYAAAKGMEIGSHTYSHPNLNSTSTETTKQEMADTTQLIVEAAGRPPLFMRPPYGNKSGDVPETMEQLGLPIVNWTVDTNDWQAGSDVGGSAITAKPGGVVLMHDIHEGTIAAVPTIVDSGATNGITYVTVGEMSDYGWQPGRTYPKEGYLGTG